VSEQPARRTPETHEPTTPRRTGRTPVISEDLDVTRAVPRALRIGAALSWRFLMVIAALYVIIWLIGYLSVAVIPLAIALLLAALLAPAVARLVRVRVPRGLATGIVLIAALAVLGGLITFVVIQITEGLPALQERLNESLDQIQAWLLNGPLHLRQEQIQEFINQAIGFIQQNQASLTSSALTTASTVGEILTGFVLTLFILIFFLSGGDRIWSFLVRGVPEHVRTRVDVAGRRGFASLVSYVRATAAVAVVDAVGIGVGLWIMQVPLVVPLATLVFLGAFVPIIGAVVTGAMAVLVALVTNGFVTALIVLLIVIGVMQLEGHVLQPLLLGRAVKLHPLAVVLAITAGLVAAGIAGALLAVPLLAVLNAGIRSLLNEEDPDPADVDVLHDQSAEPNAEPPADDENDGDMTSGGNTSDAGDGTGAPSTDPPPRRS
jgi:predicted PurR-regulated permease PerM